MTPDERQKRRYEPVTEKRCPDCGHVMSLESFPRSQGRRDGRGTYGKPCHNARGRATYTRLFGGTRAYHLKQRYGIGVDDVSAMLELQGGLCAIRRAAPAEHVDHDHETGTVRGMLCFNGNGGLGQFKDDPTRVDRAFWYLTMHKEHDPAIETMFWDEESA